MRTKILTKELLKKRGKKCDKWLPLVSSSNAQMVKTYRKLEKGRGEEVKSEEKSERGWEEVIS